MLTTDSSVVAQACRPFASGAVTFEPTAGLQAADDCSVLAAQQQHCSWSLSSSVSGGADFHQRRRTPPSNLSRSTTKVSRAARWGDDICATNCSALQCGRLVRGSLPPLASTTRPLYPQQLQFNPLPSAPCCARQLHSVGLPFRSLALPTATSGPPAAASLTPSLHCTDPACTHRHHYAQEAAGTLAPPRRAWREQ